MPHRQRIELADVAAWPNLQAALWAAARGKKSRPDVLAFLLDAPTQLALVQQAVLAGRVPDGRLREFAIQDPKPRLIHAAPFADRVAHHALVRLMEDRLEQALVPTSFACRPGRGVHAALRHAQALMLRHAAGWAVKLDVWHCFPQLPHAQVLALLARRFKGSALQLVAHIVQGHESLPGTGLGLPIGSLTSQHFANQYLGEIDRFALARPECLGHARYMDDVLLWCADRTSAQALCDAVVAFCIATLGLRLKAPQIVPVCAGLAFCGMRLGPRGLRPGQRRLRAWASRWRALQMDVQAGALTPAQAQRRADVLRALCLPARPLAWQRAVMGVGGGTDL
jgi:RNA-directed DNA polymerase